MIKSTCPLIRIKSWKKKKKMKVKKKKKVTKKKVKKKKVNHRLQVCFVGFLF